MKSIFVSIFLFCVCRIVAQTPRVTFKAPMVYPEGCAYNLKSNQFFVSSVKTGTIGTVDEKGQYKIFYEDKNLKSSFGMKADIKTNRLLVCIGEPNYSKYLDSAATFKKMARIIGLDLNTGKKVTDIDLSMVYGGKHFLNDITLDKEGNMYVTDSFSPVIYKIDSKGTPSLFAKSDFFKSIDIGLNGIAYHPGGFLLAVHNSDGAVYKIDIKDPTKITKVKINYFFVGGDGLLMDENNNLLIVQNKGVNKIYKISSSNNWQSAEIIASTASEDRFQNPTTLTMKKDKLYVLNSKINELNDPTINPSKEFSLQWVELKPVK